MKWERNREIIKGTDVKSLGIHNCSRFKRRLGCYKRRMKGQLGGKQA